MMSNDGRSGFVTEVFTGHMHYGSPYESYDNCGTCDGANCNSCRTLYEVQGLDQNDEKVYLFKRFSNKDEAVSALRKFVGEE